MEEVETQSLNFLKRLGIEPFSPLPLLSHPFSQTLLSALIAPEKEPQNSNPHIIDLPDGDQLVAVENTPDRAFPHRVLVMVHGLSGCHQSNYMIRMTYKFLRQGYIVIRMDQRGCGAGAGLARYPTHGGRSEDVRAVVEWASSRYPHLPLTLVGFSIGGNMVLKMAGEDRSRPSGRLDSLITVSAPVELERSCELLAQSRHRLFSHYFARRLTQQAHDHLKIFPHPNVPAQELQPRMSLRTFNDIYTAPLSGFKDAMDYYRCSSSRPLLNRIQVPTFVLSAADDPVICNRVWQRSWAQPPFEVILTHQGGHLGFLAHSKTRREVRWMDTVLLRWLELFDQSRLGQLSQSNSDKSSPFRGAHPSL